MRRNAEDHLNVTRPAQFQLLSSNSWRFQYLLLTRIDLLSAALSVVKIVAGMHKRYCPHKPRR